MKRLAFLIALAAATGARAQSAPQPAAAEIRAQYLIETGALRSALGQAELTIGKLEAELAAVAAPKPAAPNPAAAKPAAAKPAAPNPAAPNRAAAGAPIAAPIGAPSP